MSWFVPRTWAYARYEAAYGNTSCLLWQAIRIAPVVFFSSRVLFNFLWACRVMDARASGKKHCVPGPWTHVFRLTDGYRLRWQSESAQVSSRDGMAHDLFGNVRLGRFWNHVLAAGTI